MARPDRTKPASGLESAFSIRIISSPVSERPALVLYGQGVVPDVVMATDCPGGGRSRVAVAKSESATPAD